MVGVSRIPGAIVDGEVSFRASMPGRGVMAVSSPQPESL